MGTYAGMVERTRLALSVDESYDALIIPDGIKRCAQRILRDYHFPKMLARQVYTGLVTGKKEYDLPPGFKKPLGVYFYASDDQSFSDGLTRREGFVLPASDGLARHYWLQGQNLVTDVTLADPDAATTQLWLYYENMSATDNESWFTDDFDDVLFTYSVMRLAAELGKDELAKVYAALWSDDRAGLAIYLNELEFEGLQIDYRSGDSDGSQMTSRYGWIGQ